MNKREDLLRELEERKEECKKMASDLNELLLIGKEQLNKRLPGYIKGEPLESMASIINSGVLNGTNIFDRIIRTYNAMIAEKDAKIALLEFDNSILNENK